MIEYQPTIAMHQNDNDISIQCKYDIREIADKIAKQINLSIDEAVLEKEADTLAKYGYIKVLQCRNCLYRMAGVCTIRGFPVEPDDFCAWGKSMDEPVRV